MKSFGAFWSKYAHNLGRLPSPPLPKKKHDKKSTSARSNSCFEYVM